jgi:hypothetical protein
MLDRLVVVDYVDGAGGEYISNIVNSHTEFNSAETPLASNMQAVSDETQKWFNSRRQLNAKNWKEVFPAECDMFLDRCAVEQINNISIPYHLYIHPDHESAFKLLSNKTQFVKIEMDNYLDLVVMDYARKVLFRPLTKANFNEVKYRITNPKSDDSKELVSLMMQGHLFAIDLILYRDKMKINRENRQQRLTYLLDRQRTCPSNDIVINYEDFFVSFDKTEKSYYNLCESLNITPSSEILNAMLVRNKANFEELTEFTKNFESIKNHVLSTTP